MTVNGQTLSGGDDPIVIVGQAARLPFAGTSLSSFWEMIKEGKVAAKEIPKTRFNIDAFYHPDPGRTNTSNVRSGSFIDGDLAAFDAPFFSIPPSEAEAIDPKQRLLLETSYCALENAGIPVESIAGSETSVFIATSSHDYEAMLHRDPELQPKYMGTGVGQALIANRVSWFFNFRGPSVTLDTACSGSLVAFHLACQSLRSKESSVALVGGANLVLSPDLSMNQLSTLGFLSPDGRSYSFDAKANGYGKGEGVIVVVLKRLSDAIANNDTIRAIVRSTSVNQDGHTPGISQPSRTSQAENIRKAHALAGLDLDQTQYFEAHGTGTAVGDPIEAGAIYDAFKRPSDNPICIGGLKANIGHLEAGAGLAAVVKSTFMLEQGIMPPIAGFENVNPDIDPEGWGLKFLDAATPFSNKTARRISINSFGFGGTNGHAILDDSLSYLRTHGLVAKHRTLEHPGSNNIHSTNGELNGAHKANGELNGVYKTNGDLSSATIKENGIVNGHMEKNTENHISKSDSPITHHVTNGEKTTALLGTERSSKESAGLEPTILCWSAADEMGIGRLTQLYENYFQSMSQIEEPQQYLTDLAFTLVSRRSNLPWKAFSVINHIDDLKHSIRESCSKPVRSSVGPAISYIFNGQGSQWVAMAQGLSSNPVFQTSLVKSRDYLLEIGCPWDAIEELHKDPKSSQVNEPEFAQPLCTILQVALVQLFSSLGLKPIAVTGHSSGEIAAAYATSAISHRAAVRVAYYRGLMANKLLKTSGLRGGMISVALSADDIVPYLEDANLRTGSKITVACVNSPSNVTVSGDLDGIDLLQTIMESKGVFARKLNVNIAYHSHHLHSIAAEYASALGKLDEGLPMDHQTYMFSSVTGKQIDQQELRLPQYWVNNLVSTVKFSEALSVMSKYLMDVRRQDRDTKSGKDLLIEVGPHATLQRSVQDILKALPDVKEVEYEYSLMRNVSSILSLKKLVGRLWCRGCPIDFNATTSLSNDVSPPMALPDLPAYPFNHDSKYWYESRISHNMRMRSLPKHDFLGIRENDWNPLVPRWRNVIKLAEHPWILDHELDGAVLYPGSAMLVTAIEGFREITSQWSDKILAYQVEDITFLNSLQIPKDSASLELQLVLTPIYDSDGFSLSPHHFEVFGYSKTGWSRLCDGTIRAFCDNGEQLLQAKTLGLDQLFTEKHTHSWKALDTSQFYDSIKPQGYHLGPAFNKLTDGRLDGIGNGLTNLELTSQDKLSAEHGLSQFLIHPTDLDAIIQTSVYVYSDGGRKRNTELLIPIKIKSIYLSSGLLQSQESSALKVATATKSVMIREADFSMAAMDNTDNIRIVLNSLRQTFLSGSQAQSVSDAGRLKSCYHLDWKRDIALMSDMEILDECSKTIKEDTEDSIKMAKQQEMVCIYFMNLASETIPHTKRMEMPSHLQKYMQWIDIQLASERAKALLKHPDMAILTGTQEQRTSYLDAFIEACGPARLLVETGNNLLSILTGESDALDLLFSNDLVSDFYSGKAFTAIFERMASCIRLLAYKNPLMKVLEIGAGTGGATALVLKELGQQNSSSNSQYPAAFDSYTYTDVSPAFFEQAKQRFNDYSSKMIFSVLDMDKDVEDQGFATETYDLIVCSLVLHVATDIRKTMQNVRKLLRTGGKILILESLTPGECRGSFTFGLLPGWWFSTDENRKLCPLLDAQGWEEVFQSSGFSSIQANLPDFIHPEAMSFGVLMSTAIDSHTHSDSENIDIVVEPAIGGQKLIAHETESALLTENYKTNTINISDWIEKGNSSKACIFLLEVGHAFWNNLKEDEWNAFKKSLTHVETIVWVTQATSEADQEPFMSLATGMARAVRSQMPFIRFYELKLSSNTTGKQAVSHLLSILRGYAFTSSTNEDTEFIERDGKLCIGRLREAAPLNEKIVCDKGLATPTICKLGDELGRPLSLTINSPGQLDTLMLADDPDFDTPLYPTEVKVEIKATGINFKDILLALGQAGGSRLGFEFAGLVSEAGVESGFVKGDKVCGLTLNGAYKTWGRTDASMLMHIPSGFSFAAAAAIPLTYGTAYYSLVNLANLQPGESVLIHSGSGGVGQAAIHIAKRLNARIFVTVGSSKKRELIKRLFDIPDNHIFSSRNTDFAKGIRAMTDCGVDVVLNSLKGELQTASWTCIAPLGRFVEIGKADIEDWRRALPLKPFANNVSFSSVDLSVVMQKSKGTMKRLLDNIAKLFDDQGEVLLHQPLQVYKAGQIEEAFRHMQGGDSSGKLVIEWHPEDEMLMLPSLRPRFYLDENATYLIAGGLGGLGRVMVEWMMSRNARYFVLLSRSGSAKSAEIQQWISSVESQGATIFAPPCDITNKSALSSVLEECARTMPPIKGCIQASMVLRDNLIENVPVADIHAVLNAKTHGTVHLHHLLPKNLDFFVIFSSICALTGSRGQCNYAAAGTFQAAFARHRVQQGQKCVCINLGAVLSVGYAAEHNLNAYLRKDGFEGISRDEFLSLLDYTCDPACPISMDADLTELVNGLASAQTLAPDHFQSVYWSNRAMFRPLIQLSKAKESDSNSTGANTGTAANYGALLAAAAPDKADAEEVALSAVANRIAKLMAVPDIDIDVHKAISALGVDSLVTLEVKYWIQKELKANLSIFEITNSSNLIDLANVIVDKSVLTQGDSKEAAAEKKTTES